ncbi:hypothetical protein NMY22_g18427 [Coprinellus aureogranulatus]|nr:hypothetical protein NMY22_g18427 [Coprinellus aureogranulatus]
MYGSTSLVSGLPPLKGRVSHVEMPYNEPRASCPGTKTLHIVQHPRRTVHDGFTLRASPGAPFILYAMERLLSSTGSWKKHEIRLTRNLGFRTYAAVPAQWGHSDLYHFGNVHGSYLGWTHRGLPSLESQMGAAR